MAENQGRREFLRLAAAAGGAGLLASCSRGGAASAGGSGAASTGTGAAMTDSVRAAAAPRAASSPRPADWTALAHDLAGTLVRPGDASYTVSKRLFDPRFD